jgi:hypothetical protein
MNSSSSEESIQIYLNSQYASQCNNGLYNSDCDYILPTIEIPNDYQIYLSVQSAMIPYSFYNIDTNNNLIVIKWFSLTEQYLSSLNIIIPVGNYNAIQLSTYITNQTYGLTLINKSTLEMTFNIITNRFEFSSIIYAFSFDYILSTALQLFGFSKFISNIITPSSSYKSITVNTISTMVSMTQINLSPKKYLYIGTNLQTGNIMSINSNNSNSKNILCAIPITSSPYSTISYINYNNFSVNLYNNILSTINIKILDSEGIPINLNNQFYSLTLQLDIVNFVS